MYEFNPMQSMELLQNMRQTPNPPDGDSLSDDPERHMPHARSVRFSDLVRRVFQRISSKRRAA